MCSSINVPVPDVDNVCVDVSFPMDTEVCSYSDDCSSSSNMDEKDASNLDKQNTHNNSVKNNLYDNDVNNHNTNQNYAENDEILTTNGPEEACQDMQCFLPPIEDVSLANFDAAIDRLKELINMLRSSIDKDINYQILNEFKTKPLSSSLVSDEIGNSFYSPVNRTGRIADQDRPHAKYGSIDRQTIAKLCQFNLKPPSPSSHSLPIRLCLKSYAIISWTSVSKDTIMNYIKREFTKKNIQYICVGEAIDDTDSQTCLEIQIILHKKINKKKRFLDSIAQSCCNYQVTPNDLAWNEYIKKGHHFLEYGRFKSTKTRGPKYWSLPLSETKIKTQSNTIMRARATELTSKTAIEEAKIAAMKATQAQTTKEAARNIDVCSASIAFNHN